MGAIFMSLFLGWLYWQVGNSSPAHSPTPVSISEVSVYLQNMTGAMFVCGTSAIFSALGPLLMLCILMSIIFSSNGEDCIFEGRKFKIIYNNSIFFK